MEDQSIQFNQAAGSVGNRMLLLNAVRASKGYPLQFSKVTAYTGQGTAEGGLSLDLPFILNTIGSVTSGVRLQGTARPSSSFKTGVSQLQLADLNTAEIQTKLRRQVAGSDFIYYRTQGWPKALVNSVLIESILVQEELVKALEKAFDAACATPGEGRRKRECQWLRAEKRRACSSAEAREEGTFVGGGSVSVVYENSPRKPCAQANFQWFFGAIRVSKGIGLDTRPQHDPEECHDIWRPPAKGGSSDKPDRKSDGQDGTDDKRLTGTSKDGKISVDIGVTLKGDKKGDDDDPDKGRDDGTLGLSFPKDDKDLNVLKLSPDEYKAQRNLYNVHACLLKQERKPVKVVFRSPERMVRFLGEVIGAQNHGNGRMLQILNEEGWPADLFRVHAGRFTGFNKSAVSVEGPEGETYFIPVPDNADRGHLSLQALALVMESLNLAISGKALPQPTTVILSGG